MPVRHGRELGFSTILNFQTKIGTGMGEQMLSREYYYLGTQLPIDRFLTFYYGHPGFHINNMLVILSVQIFILTSEYRLLSRLVPVSTDGLRSGVLGYAQWPAGSLQVLVVRPAPRPHRLLQPHACIPMDRPLYH